MREGCVQQLWGVLCRVAGVEQHDAQAAAAAADHADEAAPGGVRVAGLQPDRAAVAETDQGVVAVEEEAASLDREVEAHLAAADDAPDARLRHGEPGHHGEVAGAGAVAVLESVRGGEVRALEPPLRGAL